MTSACPVISLLEQHTVACVAGELEVHVEKKKKTNFTTFCRWESVDGIRQVQANHTAYKDARGVFYLRLRN